VRSCKSSAVSFPPIARVTSDADSDRFQIASNLAHELRSPLHVLNGYLEILAEDRGAEFSGESRHMLVRLRQSASELTQTVENLLEHMAALNGTQARAQETVNLSDLIAELKPASVALAKGKKIFLVWSIEPGLNLMQSDRRRVASIISNLISNGVKFTNRGGVTVRLRRIQVKHQWMFELAVTDTGIGIERERIEDAFAPFVQLSDSNSRAHRGLGLGLSLVRRNVKALGATIEVRSKPASGSRFTVHFADTPPQ
jgi:signal transduction histidine kinase